MIKNLLIISNIVFFLSCKHNSNNRKLDEERIDNNILQSEKLIINKFNDSTINGLLILKSERSIVDVLGDLSNQVKEPDNNSPPQISIRNKFKNEYLNMIKWEGSGANQFSYFTVGYISDFNVKIEILPSNFESFFTESGVRLGLGKDSIKLLKGSNYTESIGDNFEMIRYFEEQLYEAKYYFRNDSLIKFSFGYIYP